MVNIIIIIITITNRIVITNSNTIDIIIWHPCYYIPITSKSIFYTYNHNNDDNNNNDDYDNDDNDDYV